MRINFFVTKVLARGTQGHIPANTLVDVINKHDGREAYHCAFELEQDELKVEVERLDADGKKSYYYVNQSESNTAPLSFNQYKGTCRGTLGYAWFDFDSSDGGEAAFNDVKNFYARLGNPERLLFFYSGSKGFHVAVPMYYLNLSPSDRLPAALNFVANKLKSTEFKTLDTTVFNAQRKFRAPNTKHNRTGLYKIQLTLDQILTLTLTEIAELARAPQPLNLSEAIFSQPIPFLADLAAAFDVDKDDSLSFQEWSKYKRSSGERAMNECEFLRHVKASPAAITEPEWYAAASIVGRFDDGRAKFQALSKGHPGYSVQKTDDKLDQAIGSAGPRTCKGIQSLWGKCFTCPHFEKIKSPVAILDKELIPTEATGFYFIENINGKERRTPDYEGLIAALQRDKKYFIDADTENIYSWTGTHYKLTSELEIKSWLEEVMFPHPTLRISNEFWAKVKRCYVKNREQVDSLFAKTNGKMNVANGILHIAERVVTPHDPDQGFRYVLPYVFDEAAQCPNFEKFLAEVTMNRPELGQTLLEFMGYSLWPGYEDHCFLWLSGTGRNGKSTFLQLLGNLVGQYNYTSVPLAMFEKPNYLQMMDGMRINIAEENDSAKITPEVLGNLKTLSSASRIQVDQKFKTPYAMQPTAKLVFAANKPPYFSGTEDALKSRMILVPFDLKLEEHSQEGTQSAIDWQLSDKLKDELPGILNLVLLHLSSFVRRTPRKIYRSKIGHAAMNEIMKDSDTVEKWLQECVDVVALDKSEPLNLPDLFLNFKNETGDEFTNEVHFSRRLRQKLGDKIRVERRMKNGARNTLILGLKFKHDALLMVDF